MIVINERLSEFAYGYGVTRETEALLRGIGLKPTPFLPSLLHEKKLGFDVSFGRPGTALVLQFKLGHNLERFRRKSRSDAIPRLSRPFYRFSVDMDDDQYMALRSHERAKRQVYYVAPCFCSWVEYDKYFHDEVILDRSLLITPSEIEAKAGTSSGRHRLVYDDRRSYVCSEPVSVTRVRKQDMGARVKESISEHEGSLGERLRLGLGGIEQLTDRTGLFTRLSERADREDDVYAALLGLQVWLEGGQLILITESE